MRAVPACSIFFFLAALAPSQEVKLTILATTDLHGNLLPYDYYTAQPAARGLAKIATLIAEARSENPNNLLIDCGDSIQGTPLEAVYQQYIETGRLPLHLAFAGAPLDHDPMMLAMNAIGYDAMVVGNHEFNFGLKNLAAARSQATFPWISANIRSEASGSAKPFAPYVVKTVAGVKIGIVGITTPLIPEWESPEHYRGYFFDPGVEAVRRAIDELRAREHPDVVIVAAHSGLDRDLKGDTQAPRDSRENVVYELATEVRGIDAIIFGHTHSQLAGESLNGVALLQPKNWGISLGRLDIALEAQPGGGWKIASKSSRVIPVKTSTVADARVVEIARPYQELAERYLNTPVARAPISLDGRLARVEDTALIDAIQQVEMFYAKADVSFASSFNPRVTVPTGPVTVRQIAALYPYENQLYAVEGTGKMVREALENAARYFLECSGDCSHALLINPKVIGYNFDMAEGVQYEIDLTRPDGQRIRDLRWHGQSLSDTQPLRIAVNNYRAGGSAGYTMFQGAKIVWRSSEDIRDLVIRYYTEHGELPTKPVENWRIIPDAAREALRAEALAQGETAPLQ
jgi:2',3'-cyclic-nucleotide 2'-phosphodiesterase / 3'-nucleotidase